MMWPDDPVVRAIRAIQASVVRIEVKLDMLIKQEKGYEMATQATLDRLNADLTKNADATQAAAAALEGFVKTVADLTAELQAAIDSNDEAAIAAAADKLEANNTFLQSKIPETAKAVTDNTPAASAPSA